MDVFGEDLAADVQLRVGKVPDAAHAKRDELLGNLLRDLFSGTSGGEDDDGLFDSGLFSRN